MIRFVLFSRLALALAASGPAASPGSMSAAAADSSVQPTPDSTRAMQAPDTSAKVESEAPPVTHSSPRTAKPPATPPARGQVAVLQTTLGKIVIKFHDKEAPKTVANFKKLARAKFYDGTTFHRVIPGFMIQGGDPNSKNADPSDDGMGGPGYTVPAEIKLPHLRGSVATARQGDQVNPKRESSGSQFFIDVAPQPSLDAGGYTVFGEVISGMDVVDKIVALGNDSSLPAAGGGGRNPGKKAMIVHVTLEPLSKWEKPAGAATTTK